MIQKGPKNGSQSNILLKNDGFTLSRYCAGYGLEIPVTYTLVGVEKAIDWAQKKTLKRHF